MIASADPPPAIASTIADRTPDMMVVSRDAHSEVLASLDTPLPLVKANRTENALLRQAITLTVTLSVARASATGTETLQWTFQPHLQRQFCFTSITGQFSCAAAEVEELPEQASGETPLAVTPSQTAPDQTVPGTNPAAEAARIALATTLSTQAANLFETDRRLKLAPMLKAAGVSIRRSSGSVRR